ncbi:hypothetical protein DFR68_101601 [Nocardia mexicana]|uniref:Uncharacterized protein n=1 Tax=Nocardia mexicana TaxID=279262 RepID=A0A370HET8_9NOCA|nr:hypothetical protein DFR68_101601 [Nocardia mexicana]
MSAVLKPSVMVRGPDEWPVWRTMRLEAGRVE